MIWNIAITVKILFVPLSSEFSSLKPWPLQTTNLLSTTIVLFFLKCYINGVIQHIFKHLSLSLTHLRFIHVFASISSSFPIAD